MVSTLKQEVGDSLLISCDTNILGVFIHQRIVQETYNKVCSLSIDNTTIQNKLETIENMLDVGRSQTWDELQLEKAMHAIKDWLKTRSSDSRITYAMLPIEGKRLTERLAIMYGKRINRSVRALRRC